MTAWLLLLSMVNSSTVCQPVTGARILGDDLARELPAFSAIPRDAVIGFSPVPGLRRTFGTAELERIGKRYGIQVPSDSQTCFEWMLKPLTMDAVVVAMRETLHEPRTHVDVLAMSKAAVPVGQLVFPVSGLSASNVVDPATPVTWKGYVVYGDSHRFDVWARVKAFTTTTRVVAAENLLPDETVQAKQVRIETYDDFPLRHDTARSLEEVVGKVLRRPIRAGLPVLRTDLTEPLLVSRGDLVEVTVISGAAEIRLEASAENSGRKGDMISLFNPQTRKVFQGRVAGKDKAIVVAELAAALVRVQ